MRWKRFWNKMDAKTGEYVLNIAKMLELGTEMSLCWMRWKRFWNKMESGPVDFVPNIAKMLELGTKLRQK